MIAVHYLHCKKPREESGRFLQRLLEREIPDLQQPVLLKRDANGKPYLPGRPDVQFNLSHTKGLIVAVIGDEPVGVDAEMIRIYRPRLAERFFTPRELAVIGGDDRRFTALWTQKEAYLKYLGTGIPLPLPMFDVSELDVHLETYCYEERYIISICKQEA